MPETLAIPTALTLAALPALLQPLAGGTYCGVVTHDGKPHAVVLLPDRSAKRMPWQQATDWAASVEGQLPTRPVAALLYATARTLIDPKWHWTSETEGESYAWLCTFHDGFQSYHRSFEGCAVAVRLIPLTA
jgi:hypothetical protein